jgi:hypothetical protein
MKYFFLLTSFLMLNFIVFSQNKNEDYVKEFLGENSYEKSSEQLKKYLIFKSNNLFEIGEVENDKSKSYPTLNSIIIKDKKSNKIVKLSSVEFIEGIKNQTINPLLVQLVNENKEQKVYKLAKTNYILIHHTESQISKKYNSTK